MGTNYNLVSIRLHTIYNSGISKLGGQITGGSLEEREGGERREIRGAGKRNLQITEKANGHGDGHATGRFIA